MYQPAFCFLRTRFLFTMLLAFIACTVLAQTGTVRGFLYEKETGEPVIYTNVLLKGTSYGANTDINGYYSIGKVPPGDYTIVVTYMGYESLNSPVTVKANEIVTKKLHLVKSAVNLKEVEISAEKEEKKTEVRTSVIKVTPKDIKQIPSVGGEADLATYMQVLPGAITTGDQGGQVYIRGGAPVQNKVLLDGMIIYNPFHSIGFFSVFDTDILRNVDVYTGGFGAEYGGRISSIMDITTRDGTKKRISGKISTSPFSSKALIEGPISKIDEDGGGSSSFILSAKTSYLDKTSKTFYPYVDKQGLPYNFTDLYGKISINSAAGNKVNLFGFHFVDNVKYQHISNLGWTSSGAGANFVLVPGASQSLLSGNVAWSNYGIKLTEEDNKPRKSDISSFNMGLNFTFFPGKDELKYGLEIIGMNTDFSFVNVSGRSISQKDFTTELSGYIKYRKTTEKFVFEPSFRVVYYASLSELSPEPRLGMKYNVTDKFRLKCAAGLYSQNLVAANSDRDVVNMFYGFLSGSDNIPSEFNGKEVKSHLQKAAHAVFGFEYDIVRHLELNIEGYVKDFTQLTNINRDKLFDDTEENFSKPDNLKKDFIIETGIAKGVDFVAKYDYKKNYFWAVYSLGFVTRTDGEISYAPHFDRRHNVNLVWSYVFGKNNSWETDMRWNFGSGFPFTPTSGYYEKLDFVNGVNTNYTKDNGNIGIMYGDLNSERLSDYHRLDITLKKKFDLTPSSKLETFVNVINVYDRKHNIFYINRLTQQRIYQFPIIPSAGLSLTF